MYFKLYAPEEMAQAKSDVLDKVQELHDTLEAIMPEVSLLTSEERREFGKIRDLQGMLRNILFDNDGNPREW